MSVCSESLVRQLESAGFTSKIYACVIDPLTSIGGFNCLIEFFATVETVPAGPCWEAYNSLVAAWAVNLPGNCDSELDVTDFQCISSGMGPGLLEFFAATTLFPFTLCSGAEVRAYNGARLVLLSNAWNGGPEWTIGSSVCSFCYDPVFLDMLGTTSSGVVGEIDFEDECFGDPSFNSELCVAEEVNVLAAQEGFTACSGWPIEFSGPMCTSEQFFQILETLPNDLYAVLNESPGWEAADEALNALIDSKIRPATHAEGTLSDCAICFTEFRSTVRADRSYCENVYSDMCLVSNIDALLAFEKCSGFRMDVVEPFMSTSDPSGTTTMAISSTAARVRTTKSSRCTLIAVLALILILF